MSTARLSVLAALALLTACEHSQPFGGADLGPNLPFSSTFPRRLTFGSGGNVDPAWLSDGSGIIYAFPRLDGAAGDRCLGVLPPEGGQRIQTICHAPLVGDADSTNALWNPAVGPGGVLAYVRESSPVGALAPRSRELVVASLASPDPGRTVLAFPYTAPDGQLHADATSLVWADARTLVYLADSVTYTLPPLPTDTLILPVEIVRLTIGASGAAVSVVPGTSGATSLAVDSAGAIYYTLAGDSRVMRRAASDTAATVVFDFGSAGAAAGVQVRGDRLLAVLGGTLVVARLGDSAWTTIAPPGPGGVSAPALSPSGARVVVQVPGAEGPVLWLLEVP